jgi:hypothetical protein
MYVVVKRIKALSYFSQQGKSFLLIKRSRALSTHINKKELEHGTRISKDGHAFLLLYPGIGIISHPLTAIVSNPLPATLLHGSPTHVASLKPNPK